MNGQLPEGSPIGEIETSLAWLLSHTPRFMGVIMVLTHIGQGFILIANGKPLAFSFGTGDQVLQGEAARQFLGIQDSLNASLRRYTDEEFRKALETAGPEALVGETREDSAQGSTQVGSGPEPVPEHQVPLATGMEQEDRPATTPLGIDLMEEKLEEHVQSPVEAKAPIQSPGEADVPVKSPEPVRKPGYDDILDRILRSPGVTAVAVFREGSVTDSRGDNLMGILVQPAEDILLSAREILVMLATGPLVQVTLRLARMNIIIAPCGGSYLLVQTDQGINLGQIRKLVHEIGQHEHG